MGIENIIAKVASIGSDLSTRNAVRMALSLISEDEELTDQIYVEIKNKAYKEDFLRVSIEKRAVFIPQCLRNVKECPAEFGEYGWECTKCGKCPIGDIIEHGEKLGYKQFYIVPGGSLVKKVLKEKVPKGEIKAAIGIACWPELAEASEKLSILKIPLQAVPLLRAGCINTIVDTKRVKEVLEIGTSLKVQKPLTSPDASPQISF
ncbi:MAG TPA: DUF116 domain-containing protein [Thermococcaceae archaeon]|uniref:DUF116 domain-containing protein n=1 Tax=Thermococcus sibiricus TaxID=172049 RepID=A0A101EMR2_9EURY|nr:DUF116 domain-containing protein [Thermococcus sibiricus]KUK18155.1 MAG: Uncharacterized protein XD54_0543 [Thermococcus sibiricus]KUK29197.1 MAG: Uncharacterized protein XD61_0198 [Thermococcus sp. 40_45]HII68115.1 DUF116 domain-containing protein [Thermococcaceae archaeon]